LIRWREPDDRPEALAAENSKRGGVSMYHMIRNTSLKRLLVVEAPALSLAFLTAELFYKFGSFGLECLAFLATWFVISLVFDLIGRRSIFKAEAR
jgi:hypothetical protein